MTLSIHSAIPQYPLPQFLPTPNGPLEYLEYGNGPAIIALHGAMGGYDQSMILADTVLCESFRVLAVSRPGYLGTPLSAGQSPEQQADLLAMLLSALGIKRAPVIAISGGGPCAIQFALRHPHRCESLILISTVTRKNNIKIPRRFYLIQFLSRFSFFTTAMQKRAIENIERTAKQAITDATLRQQILSDKNTRKLYTALVASTFDRMDRRIAGSLNDFSITRRTEYPLEAIRVPTLIIHGTADPCTHFVEQAQSAHERIPNSELLPLPNGEHAAIFTHRALVQNRISSFLARHKT